MKFLELNVKSGVDYDICLRDLEMNPVADIPIEFITSIDLKFNDISSIVLEIPKYISSNTKTISNPLYDLVKDEMLITLNDKYCFIVKDIEENEKDKKNLKKKFTAFTREKKLTRRNISFSNQTMQIKKNDVNNTDGVLDILEQETNGNWTTGYVDTDAYMEIINGEQSIKYRYFDSSSRTWLQLLRQDFADSFQCLFLIDSFNKQINVYAQENIGECRGLYLSYDNFVKQINRKKNNERIITRLNVEGKDNSISISGINPTGTTYLDDFSAYYDIIPPELVTALNKYNTIINEKQLEWLEIKGSITILNNQKTEINNVLMSLNEELVALNALRNSYITNKDNESLTYVNGEIGKVENQIANNNSELTIINTQIAEKNELIDTNIVQFLDKKTCLDENGYKVFTDDMLKILDDLIQEESWKNDYFLTSSALYRGAVETLNDKKLPQVEFTVDAMSFIDAVECPRPEGWDYFLRLGDTVIIYSDNFGETDIYLTGINHQPNSKQLKLTFSNKLYVYQDINLGSTISNAKDAKAGVDKINVTVEEVETEISDARKDKPTLKDKIDEMDTAILNNTTELTLARRGKESLVFKIDEMDDATESNTNEIIAARKGEDSLKLKIDDIDTNIENIATEITNARNGKTTLDEKIDDIDTNIQTNTNEITNARKGETTLVDKITALEGVDSILQSDIDDINTTLTTNVVNSVNTRKGDVVLTSSDVGLENVENKSSETIRSEITSENVITSLGYTPPKKYSSNIGDGIATEITITHNLNTMDIVLSLREVATPYNGIVPNWQIVDVNSIKLTFEIAPTTDQYRVVIIG